MWIYADAESFKPENFAIIDFYGTETCFAWQKKYMVAFPYGRSTSSNPKLPVIVAPREIKTIRSFDSRIFVLCKPAGVYKLNKLFKFCLLSQTGIGLGRFYYEVFSPENHWLYMKNKLTKTNRQLFRLQTTSSNRPNICEITLNSTNSDRRLLNAICQSDDGDRQDVCVVANDKNVFAIFSGDVQLIHRCQKNIVDVVPISGNGVIAGFVLVDDDSAILVYVNGEKLIFDGVFLDGEVRALCAVFDETSDNIWIAHVDDSCLHFSTKNVRNGAFRRIRTDRGKLLAIANYKNEILIGLSNDKRLFDIEIPKFSSTTSDLEEFFNLEPEMLKGSEIIMDEVCERAKELQLFNEILLDEQEKLRRINIYAHKQAIVFLPIVRVERIAGRTYLRVEFGNVLPMNCHVVVALKSATGTTYCMKLVEDCKVFVDVPVETERLDDSLELCVDLVTVASESEPWCLVRNYTKSPRTDVARTNAERAKFLRAKLGVLSNLERDGNLDMKELSNLKRSIRKEC